MRSSGNPHKIRLTLARRHNYEMYTFLLKTNLHSYYSMHQVQRLRGTTVRNKIPLNEAAGHRRWNQKVKLLILVISYVMNELKKMKKDQIGEMVSQSLRKVTKEKRKMQCFTKHHIRGEKGWSPPPLPKHTLK
ncbi:hypothetical protein KP509_16G050600 [Ceratopteris richardii]|uniref:Uncharacterized protein n=1 Tax=Ceratopteris richardii TaxID=49495 RepID=A0A8T2SZI8_CERRI|nr:hypothetical protein KP509_16G050600 [Ceratopteris richardii]